MRILIIVNGNVFLEGCLQLCLQSFNKGTYPFIALVVLLAIGDEDVIIISFDYA
jgi:hypothetical protein